MLKEIAAVDLPPRSKLFSLPLAGTDGSTQEALLDFAQRLSVEHRVRVRDLLSRVILPEADLKGAFYVPGHFAAHAIRGCNGWSDYAVAFLGAMQRLTGRSDMAHGSLMGWADLLDHRGYVACHRRWCPECLRAQRRRGFHSFSLLWAFEPVKICPEHGVWLCESCGECRRTQPLIGDALARGLCEHCQARLSDSDARLVTGDVDADYFVAKAMSGMIEVRERAGVLATESNYRLRIKEVADRVANGSILRLERQLNLSYMSLTGSRRHRLQKFLEIMFRLGVEPVPFLAGEARAQPVPSRAAAPYRTQSRRSPSDLAADGHRVEEQLQWVLSEPTRVVPRIHFARAAGISNSCLQNRFPEAKAALRVHNDQARVATLEALWPRRADLIEQAMKKLVTGRGPLTAGAVSKALREIGLHRLHPKVRMLAREAIQRALAGAATKASVQTEISGE